MNIHEATAQLVAGLPRCSGEWTGGSGLHRMHTAPCRRPATYDDDPFHYCDEHVSAWHLDKGHIHEHYYAPALRELASMLQEPIEQYRKAIAEMVAIERRISWWEEHTPVQSESVRCRSCGAAWYRDALLDRKGAIVARCPVPECNFGGEA